VGWLRAALKCVTASDGSLSYEHGSRLSRTVSAPKKESDTG